jgi:APA family basic amino acid/polyamine antiporter
LPPKAWERFGIWLAVGLALYFVYGYRHSTLRGSQAASVEHPPS